MPILCVRTANSSMHQLCGSGPSTCSDTGDVNCNIDRAAAHFVNAAHLVLSDTPLSVYNKSSS
jgi:hypothetical protein